MPCALSTDKILHTNEMLTWRDFSALSFDICVLQASYYVVLNTKFKLISFFTLTFAVFV
jgi:hypothetical protein